MRYESFEIANFKGIKRTKIEFDANGTLGKIFTLVGLNESGKTTLLEAIHSFSPDEDSQVIFSEQSFAKIEKAALIPRHRVSNFSDSVSVKAMVVLTPDDKKALATFVLEALNATLNISELPTRFIIESKLRYKNSVFEKQLTIWNIFFKLRAKGKRSYVRSTDEEWQKIIAFLTDRLPSIAYFPTFVFEFPSKIYLAGREEDKINLFYRNVFQDILHFQGEGLNIEEHVVARARRADFPSNPLEFIALILGSGSPVKHQIDQVMFKASSTISKVIFEKWNEIFHHKLNKKEIIIEWQPEVDGAGKKNVFIQFFIKDGVNKYAVSERSLGFRWFFCFLLFTQFRASRKDPSRGTIFIFDEPASNLHSRAQEQLLESFPRISTGQNILIYSTHSHYMINPYWLEQTYIIENKAITYDADELEAASREPETEIVATRYRRFVGENPDKSTYFQPILDKLDFAPSKLYFPSKAILLEGKSDFYILSFFEIVKQKIADHVYVPSAGANDLAPLIALYLGWGRRFVVMVDGDKTGRAARLRYLDEFTLPEQDIIHCPDAAGDATVVEIEDTLAQDDLTLIAGHFNITGKPSKKNIMRFFQEKLAANADVDLSPKCLSALDRISRALRKRVGLGPAS